MTDVYVGGFRTQTTGEQTIANYLWDTNSLSWVPQTASTGGTGGSVSVTNSYIPAQQYGTWTIKSITDPVVVTGSFYQATQPVSVAQTVDTNVTNFPAVQATTAQALAKRYEVVSPALAYFGQAAVGSNESASTWQIQELTFSAAGNVTTKYVNGSASFTNKWSERTTLNYQ